MGAGVQRGAGSVPTPGHCICAKVSHSVGMRGRPWGVASPALPGLQSADKAWLLPTPQLSEAAQAPELQFRQCPYPVLEKVLFIWARYGRPAGGSPVSASMERGGNSL